MDTKTNTMEFKTISQAKKSAGVSYLGSINSSAKIKKSQKYSGVYTYIVYLAPSNSSGYNVCSMATKECIAGCLNTAGRVKMDVKNTILNARTTKTKLFFEQRDFFLNWLVSEIAAAKRKAERDNFKFSVRLNGTSDIAWFAYKIDGKTIFELFPDVIFYDYTKIVNYFTKTAKYNNYHLTYSFTGYNVHNSKEVLSSGNNVAVIFNIKKGDKLPQTFMGYPVTDGDLTDYRPDDGNGVVVGLRWKNIKNKGANELVKKSAFVVQKEDVRISF
jgi:hypothetical protein